MSTYRRRERCLFCSALIESTSTPANCMLKQVAHVDGDDQRGWSDNEIKDLDCICVCYCDTGFEVTLMER